VKRSRRARISVGLPASRWVCGVRLSAVQRRSRSVRWPRSARLVIIGLAPMATALLPCCATRSGPRAILARIHARRAAVLAFGCSRRLARRCGDGWLLVAVVCASFWLGLRGARVGTAPRGSARDFSWALVLSLPFVARLVRAGAWRRSAHFSPTVQASGLARLSATSLWSACIWAF